MALFGTRRDIDTFKIISKELVNDVITQQVGYYKIVLKDTDVNIYGESLNKHYSGPVLLNCLIDRGEFESPVDDYGVDTARSIKVMILRDELIETNVYPENGDIVFYNELYYEVDNVNNNQLILGKDNEYAYSTGLENYGDNYSTILTCHITRVEKLNINNTVL